ncbi:MAG: sterol desaturase family protein [Polyangiaceae bacterium]|nr:sterol desaturase family protein [Polyangiaceae bacterium]
MQLFGELLRPIVAFAIATALFGLVEWLGRRRASPPWKRAGFWTDSGWWMLTPLATKAITRIGVGVAIFTIAWVSLGHPTDKEGLRAFVDRPTWASALPLPFEILLTLTVADFVGYWIHRAFHRGWLWRSHAVHHSSERLDWLAAVRVHPINDLLAGVTRVALLVLLGFRPTVLAGIVPFSTFYAVLLHANVPWSFGWVGRIIASPRFHRWHHAKHVSGDGANFAGFFVLWDRLFGTFYLPSSEPAETGIAMPMPKSIWGQLVYPFRKPDTKRVDRRSSEPIRSARPGIGIANPELPTRD